jgi:hypothetical protein
MKLLYQSYIKNGEGEIKLVAEEGEPWNVRPHVYGCGVMAEYVGGRRWG